MPELTVPLWQWILSQVFGVAAVVFAIWAMQIKRKAKTIVFMCLSNIAYAVSVMFLFNWVVFVTKCVAAVRSFVFFVIEKGREKGREVNPCVSFILMLAFMAAGIVSVVFTQTWWFDWIILLASLLVIFASWAKGIHLLRIACFLFDSLVFVNHIRYFNVVGMIMSALMVGAVVVFYIRFFAKKRKAEQEELQTAV